MTAREFSQRLQTWKGRAWAAEVLVERGFGAHLVTDRELEAVARVRGIRHDIGRFHSELAREYVCSAGESLRSGREAIPASAYRSDLIDSLEPLSASPDGSFGYVPFLHPAMRMDQESGGENSLWRKIRAASEVVKLEEARQRAITDRGFTGLRRELMGPFQDFAVARGLVQTPRARRVGTNARVQYEKSSDHLTFHINLDTGGFPWVADVVGFGGLLPVQTWISMKTDRSVYFYTADLRFVWPGMEQYAYFASPVSAMVGLCAFVESIVVLSESF